MIDNFEQIKKLMVFPKDDSFYFVQVLQRKKDHPGIPVGGSNNNSRLVRAYHITSQENLEVHKKEMIALCETLGARACINLNPRSFEKAAYDTLIKIADQMKNKAFYNVRKAYDTVCGNYHAETDKRWLVDIDVKDLALVEKVINDIEILQAEDKTTHREVLAVIPSKAGYHIITQPFRMDKFKLMYPGMDVHPNNPTSLYIP